MTAAHWHMTATTRALTAAVIALALPYALHAQLTVTLLDYHATVPAGWVTAPATSSMRLAQTYARGIGAGDAANAKSGQSLVAVIAETPRGTLFFQLFGATAAVTGQRSTLVGFARNMK